MTLRGFLTLLLQVFWFLPAIQALGQHLLESERRLRSSGQQYSEPSRNGSQFVTAPKISQRLRDLAAKEQIVPVFLVLADQALREVHRRVEASNSIRLENAEAAYDALAPGLLPDIDGSLTRARQILDSVMLAIRQETAREMEARVRPQQDEIEALLRSLGATRIGRYSLLNMLRADIPSAALSALEADPRIEEIAMVEKHEAHLDVSAPALGAPAFWSTGFTGSGESVAVLDSGVYAGHPAFGGRVRSASFVSDNPNCPPQDRSSTDDFHGHGTHVAGIIASQGTPALPQVLGVARGLSTLFSLKISCGPTASSFTSDTLAAAVLAVTGTSAAIVNDSNGASSPAVEDDDLLSRTIDELVDTFNLVWVNSAGNLGPLPRSISSPGTALNVITVGNLDTKGTVGRFDDTVHQSSSRGPTANGRFKPDVVAPGTTIFSTDRATNGFVPNTGTSMASPHVAGAAALIRQAGLRGRLGIKALLLNTTDTFGWQPDRGWGSANLNRALTQIRNNLSSELGTEAGSFRLFRGTAISSDEFSATLVWNRFVLGTASFLRNVDLFLYKRETGSVLAQSTLNLQNVEQVGAPGTVGNVVLKVRAGDTGRGFTEPFAIAVSSPGFVAATGPVFDVTCVGPNPATPSAITNVSCTASNRGDLDAFAVNASLSIVGSMAVPVSQSFGAISPQGSASRSFTITAPASGSTFQLRLVVASASYGETFGDTRLFTVSLSGGSGGGTRPVISGGVVNGASFQPGFAAAQWLTIRGTNLANVTRTLDFVNGSYPTASDGVSVTLNGRPAPLYYLSPIQLNVISPDLAGSGPVQVVVTNSGAASDAFTAQLQPVAPAFFPWPGNYAVATDPNFQLKVKAGTFPGASTTPARPGDVIILWGTGFGPTNPSVAAGQQVLGDRLYAVASPVRITIGGVQAELFGAALAPGFASLYQVAVRVPTLSDGDYPVVAEVVGVMSPSTTLLTVQR